MPKIKIFLDKGNNNNNCPRRVLAQTAKTRGGTLEVPVYREENFAVPEKISIFEKRLAKDCPKVRKELPKVCWGSNKHAKDSGNCFRKIIPISLSFQNTWRTSEN